MNNALDIILSQLRVSGAIVLSQAHPIPWSVRVPKGNSLRPYMRVGNEVTVVPFHIAKRGHFELPPASGEPMVVQANQLVMCANGEGHVMSSGDSTETLTFEQVMSAGSFDAPQSNAAGHTEVVCGVFMLRNTHHNPLINDLPDFMLVDIQEHKSSSTMQLLNQIMNTEIDQPRNASSYMLERVLELLYAESIRLYSEQNQNTGPTWLAAINDKKIGPALSYIHSHLDQPIQIKQLADQATLSPSRFTAKFSELLGISPKAYVTSQRQALAAQMLRETSDPIQMIAFNTGYQSIPSFNKSFFKYFGMTPSQWRIAGK